MSGSPASRSQLTRGKFLAGAVGVGGVALGGGWALLDSSGGNPRHRGKGGRGVLRFISRPDLKPPRIKVVHPAESTANGLLFLAPSSGPGKRGPLIVDDKGEVVWFNPTSPETVMNFRAALYRGAPVLTWWEGKSKHGVGVGDHVIVDQSYREIARFPAGDHLASDLHEFIVTPEGTALVTSYDIPTVDLSSVGKGRGRVIEGIVQELEIPSARVLFEWRSLDHVPVGESYMRVAPAFDYFHINAIDIDADGNLLVSGRNTWTVYKIDRTSGKVIWRLGGKKSDFSFGKGARFGWQHDARHHGNDGWITIFDNARVPNMPPFESQSRGLALGLDLKAMRATLLHEYLHSPPMLAHALGSVQVQPNGNVLVGWGTEPYFTEYAEDGTVRFDATLPRGGQNYRTLRFPWQGKPTEPPAIAAVPTPAGHRVYVSWNGATDVASWRVLTGKSAAALQLHATVPRAGFETHWHLGPEARFVAVTALDASGAALGRSATLAL